VTAAADGWTCQAPPILSIKPTERPPLFLFLSFLLHTYLVLKPLAQELEVSDGNKVLIAQGGLSCCETPSGVLERAIFDLLQVLDLTSLSLDVWPLCEALKKVYIALSCWFSLVGFYASRGDHLTAPSATHSFLPLHTDTRELSLSGKGCEGEGQHMTCSGAIFGRVTVYSFQILEEKNSLPARFSLERGTARLDSKLACSG